TADAGAAAGHQRQLPVESPAVRVHCGFPVWGGRSIAPGPIEDAAMPRPLAMMIVPGALLLACAGCNRPPPPPPDQPPEPQAHTQLRDVIQAPIERAQAVEGAVQDAAAERKAAI